MNETASNTISINEQITATATLTKHHTYTLSMHEGAGFIVGIVIWCITVLSCSFLLIKMAKSQWRIKNGTLYNSFHDATNIFSVNDSDSKIQEIDIENPYNNNPDNAIMLTEINNNNNPEEKLIKT